MKWRKYIIVVVLGVGISFDSFAQTQALRQLQLDIEKLAQLKIMLNSMYSEYATLASGYNNIKSQATETFSLHKHYIDALSVVSPAVRNAPAIASILSVQAQIVREYKTTYNGVVSSGVFTKAEINDLTDACSEIIGNSSVDLDALQQVITTGKLQMSDPDRLLIIESLGEDMEKQLAALRNFTSQANKIVALRLRNKRENNLLRNTYGIAK
jgi:hypothetical protein